MMSNIRMLSWSIWKEKGMVKFPTFIQSKIGTITASVPLNSKKIPTLMAKDNMTIKLANALITNFGKTFLPNPFKTNPTKGNTGINQAKFTTSICLKC